MIIESDGVIMNIIKHGHTPRLYYAECKECGCEFTFTKDDVEYDEGSQYEPTDYKTCTLWCPECRHNILCICDKTITKDMFLIKYLEYVRNLEYLQAR